MLTHSALVSPVKTESVLSPWSFSSDTTGNQISWCKDLIILKSMNLGVLLSSVGSVRDPCAEALQWTWVRLSARVLLLCVTPPLLPCFLSHCSTVLSVNEARKGQKKYWGEKSMNLNKKILCCLLRGKYLFSSGQKSGSTTWQHPGSW